jgi:hypothetical protein
MPSVDMPIVVMLNVIMLSVVMLSFVSPNQEPLTAILCFFRPFSITQGWIKN